MVRRVCSIHGVGGNFEKKQETNSSIFSPFWAGGHSPFYGTSRSPSKPFSNHLNEIELEDEVEIHNKISFTFSYYQYC